MSQKLVVKDLPRGELIKEPSAVLLFRGSLDLLLSSFLLLLLPLLSPLLHLLHLSLILISSILLLLLLQDLQDFLILSLCPLPPLHLVFFYEAFLPPLLLGALLLSFLCLRSLSFFLISSLAFRVERLGGDSPRHREGHRDLHHLPPEQHEIAPLKLLSLLLLRQVALLLLLLLLDHLVLSSSLRLLLPFSLFSPLPLHLPRHHLPLCLVKQLHVSLFILTPLTRLLLLLRPVLAVVVHLPLLFLSSLLPLLPIQVFSSLLPRQYLQETEHLSHPARSSSSSSLLPLFLLLLRELRLSYLRIFFPQDTCLPASLSRETKAKVVFCLLLALLHAAR